MFSAFVHGARMAMRQREQAQAAEATSGAADEALTERWYELRNLVDSLRVREARIAELSARLAPGARPGARDQA
jgi:hypothetical protein